MDKKGSHKDSRHAAIGIKQVLRPEWLKKTTDLLLAGMDGTAIRHELHDYLSTRKGDGTLGQRSELTRTFAVNNLMNIWVSPAAELASLRESALALLRKKPEQQICLHWAMTSAAYPFWFNVARQTGRLLALQDQITKMQIETRLKEHYGDRQTVSRYGRFVVRSFVAWNVIRNADNKGCYTKSQPLPAIDPAVTALLFESALFAMPEGRASLPLLKNNPAFFPFQFADITGEQLANSSQRMSIERYGRGEEILCITVE